MRYIADSNGYLLEVSFGAEIQCGGKNCTEYTGAVPSGYTSLAGWFAKEGDKLYRWKITAGQLTRDSDVAVKPEPGVVFAPAGHGLGNTVTDIKVENLDSTHQNGWYRIANQSLTVSGYTYSDWHIHVKKYSSSYLVQEMWPISAGRYKLVRSCVKGTWVEEWENPPMVPGKAYRTTERWNEKAVYVKVINFGTIPSDGNASVSTGVSNVTYIDHTVRYVESSSDVTGGPVLFTGGSVTAYSWVTPDNNCTIRAVKECEGCTAEFIIKYVKN